MIGQINHYEICNIDYEVWYLMVKKYFRIQKKIVQWDFDKKKPKLTIRLKTVKFVNDIYYIEALLSIVGGDINY